MGCDPAEGQVCLGSYETGRLDVVSDNSGDNSDTPDERTAFAETSRSLGAEQPCEHIPYDMLSEMFKVVLAAAVAVWVGREYL